MNDLSQIELFKDISSLEINGAYFDLHNEFLCTKISYLREITELEISFEGINDRRRKVRLKFTGVDITRMDLFRMNHLDMGTLNIMYRGRFEKNGQLLEYSGLQKKYFYFEFENGDVFEIFCQEAELLEI